MHLDVHMYILVCPQQGRQVRRTYPETVCNLSGRAKNTARPTVINVHLRSEVLSQLQTWNDGSGSGVREPLDHGGFTRGKPCEFEV